MIRSPSKASRLTGSPFRVISRTAGAVRLMKLAEPGATQSNLITLTEPNTSSSPVRSRSTWYEATVMIAERAAASSRVPWTNNSNTPFSRYAVG